jgi:RecJ-like exonuclease
MSMWNLSPGGGIDIDPEDLRSIIQGKCMIRKCPDCNGDGNVYWHYKSDDDENPRQVSRQFFDDWENRDNDEDNGPSVEEELCETCWGVGYIAAIKS